MAISYIEEVIDEYSNGISLTLKPLKPRGNKIEQVNYELLTRLDKRFSENIKYS